MWMNCHKNGQFILTYPRSIVNSYQMTVVHAARSLRLCTLVALDTPKAQPRAAMILCCRKWSRTARKSGTSMCECYFEPLLHRPLPST